MSVLLFYSLVDQSQLTGIGHDLGIYKLSSQKEGENKSLHITQVHNSPKNRIWQALVKLNFFYAGDNLQNYTVEQILTTSSEKQWDYFYYINEYRYIYIYIYIYIYMSER